MRVNRGSVYRIKWDVVGGHGHTSIGDRVD